MTKHRRLFYIIFLIVITTGCGYREGIIQPAQKSYLWFTGNIDNAVAYVDDNAPFSLQCSLANKEDCKSNSSLVHYQLSPGKHNVVIKRNDKIVANRVLMLGEGMTTEIDIP